MTYELLVVGSSLAGLSVASRASRAGIDGVRVMSPSVEEVPAFVHLSHLDLETSGVVDRISSANGNLAVHAGSEVFSARNVVIDLLQTDPDAPWPWPVSGDLSQRLHRDLDFPPEDHDVLVVGSGEAAVALATRLVQGRARVVLSFDGETPGLSLLGMQALERLEREQLATILWRSRLEAIWSAGDFPMVTFDDRRTPDLQFDHVVLAMPPASPEIPFPLELDADSADGLFVITESGNHSGLGVSVSPKRSWDEIRRRRYPEVAPLSPAPASEPDAGRVRELAAMHYNATITSFDTAHNELWRIRLRPDREAIAHRAGQYCSIGLGYWEPRADDSLDPELESKRDRLIRRSYSISSPILDERGYLADPSAGDEIELYIVWVTPDENRVPALTPRLALKHAGDRLYLGPKVAGRYTVERVDDPSASVVFVATGTGEAPHNAMIVELLRRGHFGRIVSLVTVRYLSDLAYEAEHRELEQRYANYTYLPVPTREPGHPKRYAQDLLEDGDIEAALGTPLDPASTHVFLCGNPSMIGLPEFIEDRPVFPETTGMVEMLVDRGFTLDRHKEPGNIHYEEYW